MQTHASADQGVAFSRPIASKYKSSSTRACCFCSKFAATARAPASRESMQRLRPFRPAEERFRQRRSDHARRPKRRSLHRRLLPEFRHALSRRQAIRSPSLRASSLERLPGCRRAEFARMEENVRLEKIPRAIAPEKENRRTALAPARQVRAPDSSSSSSHRSFACDRESWRRDFFAETRRRRAGWSGSPFSRSADRPARTSMPRR